MEGGRDRERARKRREGGREGEREGGREGEREGGRFPIIQQKYHLPFDLK